jgi:hypothetical protein
MQLFANNATSVLASSITNVATSLTLNTGDGSKFPSPTGSDFFLTTLIGRDTNGVENAWEIVKVTARAGDVLTIVRGQESTTAAAWGAGTPAQARATATTMSALENSSNKDATGGYVGMTLFKINFKNAANTFTSFLTNTNTAARTYTFQDRNGTIADDTDLALKANLASPTFTGTPTLPTGTIATTQTAGNNTTAVATTAFVTSAVATTLASAQSYADGLVVGLWDDRGNYDASVNTFPASGGSGSAGAVLKGDIWTISVAGTLGGVPVTTRQTVRATVDTPGQTLGNWAIGLANTDLDDSITDGVTGRAPSQNAVFDALALKAALAGSSSQAFAASTLTAATSIATGTGTTTTAGLKFLNGTAGAFSGYGSIYPENVTPSTTNWAFISKFDGSATGVNATGHVFLQISNAVVADVTSIGLAVTGTGSTSGVFTAGLGTATTAVINVGAIANAINGGSAVRFLNSNSTTNWQVSSNLIGGGALDFTPSTAGGGATFSTAVMSLSTAGTAINGVMTLAGTAATNTTVIDSTGTTTGSQIIQMRNTTGRAMFGIESSAGGSQISGSAAYSSFAGSVNNAPFYGISNGAIVTTTTAGSFAVTGTFSSTGTATFGDGTAITNSIVNGLNSGSNGGASHRVQNAGTVIIAIGNKSNIAGGAYSATPYLYANATIETSVGMTLGGAITTTGGATFHTTSTALTNGAGAGAGTITNAPSAGNPTKWIGINDNGTTRYIPAW